MKGFKRARAARMSFTPQALVAQAGTITSRQRRVFEMVQRKDERLADRARALLIEHTRQPGRAIALDQHDRLWRLMGLARSAQWLFIAVLPLAGTLLLALSHIAWGFGAMAVALVGLLVSNLWRVGKTQRMELADLEVAALKKIALSDTVARPVFLNWKKDGLPLTQEEFQIVENWLSAHRQVKQWEEAQALSDQMTPKTVRRFKRNHRP